MKDLPLCQKSNLPSRFETSSFSSLGSFYLFVETLDQKYPHKILIQAPDLSKLYPKMHGQGLDAYDYDHLDSRGNLMERFPVYS